MQLLRLSGHSGAGKSRLVRALTSQGISCPRTLLYTSRPPRDGEAHGIDYYFLSRGAIAALPADQFLIRPVRNMLQAVDLLQLQMDLQENPLILVEIFHENWPPLVSEMKTRLGERLRTRSLFLTAVDPHALHDLPDEGRRAEVIRSEVTRWLRWRGKDSPRNIEKRAQSATAEVLEAIGRNGPELYDKVIHSSPEGPDGEDDWTSADAPRGRAEGVIKAMKAFLSARTI